VDPDFSMNLWDHHFPQAVLTLNLLRTSRLHAHMSGAAHLCGPFDYNKTRLAPPGTNTIANKKTNQCRTWAPHSTYGYSLGTAMHHYCCHRVYITSTASECIVDTLDVVPSKTPMPQISSTDILLMTVHGALKNQFQRYQAFKRHPFLHRWHSLCEIRCHITMGQAAEAKQHCICATSNFGHLFGHPRNRKNRKTIAKL
jgi:hypothetical protein